MQTISEQYIIPNWPAPENVQAFCSSRKGGVSKPPFDSFNLGLHVGDNPSDVLINRNQLPVPNVPYWLNQTHSVDVVEAISAGNGDIVSADGSYTSAINRVCVVMTADCLPILLCNKSGTQVFAVHAGWRGLVDGIIANAVAKFASTPCEYMAWIGPGISQQAFEVGEDVLPQFENYEFAIRPSSTDRPVKKYNIDLVAIANDQLQQAGVAKVFGGNFCTYNQSAEFFSYRRDGKTGRMVTAIWLTE